LGENLPGKLFGVGVGPGNPQLVTIKASQVLMTADVICAPKASPKKPSLALKTVKDIIQSSSKRREIIELVYPMVKDKKLLEETLERNAEIIVSRLRDGKNVAFITLGDPMFYSTFIYTYRKVIEKMPYVEVEVIPGVTSPSACAATSKTPIAEAEQAVVIVPTTSNLRKLEKLARQADTIIIMKGAKNMEDLCEVLRRSGFGENSQAVIANNVGTPAEEVKVVRLCELRRIKGEPYLSTIIVKR
jgi:precorrin-2/cobalt-factor-2 C20-methyltransferase